MSGLRWAGGWLMIPYDGDELARIEISIDGELLPAYRDWADDGTRVVQVRADENALRQHVTLAVNGEILAEFRARRRLPASRHGVT